MRAIAGLPTRPGLPRYYWAPNYIYKETIGLPMGLKYCPSPPWISITLPGNTFYFEGIYRYCLSALDRYYHTQPGLPMTLNYWPVLSSDSICILLIVYQNNFDLKKYLGIYCPIPRFCPPPGSSSEDPSGRDLEKHHKLVMQKIFIYIIRYQSDQI